MHRSTLAPAILLLTTGLVNARAQSDLGTITFQNSGSLEAQKSFGRGVSALHSFWYEEAAEAFRKAQEIDPNFALAYWGEAMSYNHPLWSEQDIAAAQQTLQRFGKTSKERLAKIPTERERTYLKALDILYYGKGNKLERDIAYSKAMARLAENYPDDLEAQAFFALSLLGMVRRGDPGSFRQMQAGAIVLDIFNQNPDHPGAAHYVIHSFDDPEHAPLALPAANRYAKIAPESHHALHMPTHIFVQHGMWHRVAEFNVRSYNASAKWVAAKNLSITKRDYHSLQWEAYANLQRGAYSKVLEAIQIVADAAKQTQSTRLDRIQASMFARYMIESRRFQSLPLPDDGEDDDSRYNSTASTLLALGMGAAERGDINIIKEAARRIGKFRKSQEKKHNTYRAKNLAIMEHELNALERMVTNETAKALEQASMAAAIEETQDPPSGPTYPLKPSHELYGELLLDAGKYEESIIQLETSLQRTPNRTASLLAIARAATKIGDIELASESYRKLRLFLNQADIDVPFLKEVQTFKSTTGTYPK